MPRVIYFLRGCPTEEQWEEARIMGAVFRNPDAVGQVGDFFEDCEAVCGESIPVDYADKPVLDCSAVRPRMPGIDRTVKPAAKSAGRAKAGKKKGE